MPGILPRATALAAVALVAASGCSWRSGSVAAVSASELQKALVAQLAKTGTPSTWVNCGKDLPARVGATTRCDVMFNHADGVTAILTTTQVQGDAVTWEITRPQMTKDQVTRRLVAAWRTEAVVCNSGLDGNVGDWAQCEITKDGMNMTQTLEVKAVQGLSLDLTPTISLPKQAAEDMLRNKLTTPDGPAPESATCPGDLVGGTGTVMDCVATTGGRQQTYTLSVSDAAAGAVGFDPAVQQSAPADAARTPEQVQAAPEPAPVESPPSPTRVEAAPAPTRVESAPETPTGVPHLSNTTKVMSPPGPVEPVPHLQPGAPPNYMPGPIATQTGGGQIISQASGG